MSTPQLSIVLPVYNVDRWLNQCLDSIQQQTFQNWEALLIDDGSTDFSGIIAENYARKDSRFRVIRQENRGVSAARNAGIEAATGDLLSFIDPDDLVSRNCFQALISAMRRIDADVSVCAHHYIDEHGNSNPVYEFIAKRDIAVKGFPEFAEMLNNEAVVNGVYNNIFSCVSWGKVFKRELWDHARFPVDVDLGEDMMTVPGVIIKASRAVCVPEAIYYYRQRKKSLLHGTVNEERYLKDLAASSAMLEQLCEHSPENRDSFQSLKLLYDFGCFSNYLQANPKEARSWLRRTLARAIKDSEYYDSMRAVFKGMLGMWDDE